MLVFTLPSFPYVFKLIRDRFAPPKEIDRQTVKDKYLMVKLHDRVGRMADTLEYSLRRAAARALRSGAARGAASASAARSSSSTATQLVVGHVYIERRMQPLNLLRRGAAGATATTQRLRAALREYGNAIKELAGAGIFPGDMLLKNFGVTRHDRVVFYDYDEIQPIGRHALPPHPAGAELRGGALGRAVLVASGRATSSPSSSSASSSREPRAREIFYEYHRDLLDPAVLERRSRSSCAPAMQEDVFPYPEELRFPR